VEISLAGEHQGENGAVAVVAAQVLAGNHPAITENAIRSGMAATRWPCRLELVSRKPLIVVDVAHNAAGARRLQAEVSRAFADKRVILVLAISNDKDADAIASILCPDAEVVIVTQYQMHRHMPAEQLFETVSKYTPRPELSYSVAEAVQKARSIASDDTLILITGSLFTAGEAKQILKPLVSADDSLG
jgi:dihydrofolate synthase/folylpolyglutamate synthase